MKYIGKIIKGRYKIYDKIGSGGMASVYLARDLQTNEVVAIKILKEEFTEEEKYLERFKREAETALRLKHKNIARVKDFGKEGNTYYIIMEYIQGKTLEDILKEKGAIPPEEVIRIGIEVARALDFSVKHGIIAHRDIKPQNIMLTKNGTVKVMDFGIAKVSATNSLTTEGSILGTPYYISPEQAKGQSADIRSDLYSLGITLYTILTGKVPFDAENPWSIINMHLTTPPPEIEKIRKDVPRALQKVIYKLLKKNPEERYQTPEELIKDLENIGKTTSPKETVIINKPVSKLQKTVIINKKNEDKKHSEKRNETVIINQPVMKEKSQKRIERFPELPNKKIATTIPRTSNKQVNSFNVLLKYKNYLIIIAIVIIGTGLIFAKVKRTRPSLTNSNVVINNTGTASTGTENSSISTKPAVNYATLEINSEPQGTEIFLNGEDTGFKTPAKIKNLKSGKYTITLKLNGYNDFTKEITISSIGTLKETFKLESIAITVQIKSNPEGATIIIDGKNTNKITPAIVSLNKGTYNLTLKLKGYKDLSKTIHIDNKNKNFIFTLQKINSEEHKGAITVSTTPEGASVYINGKLIGKTPTKISLTKGKYTVKIDKSGYNSITKTVEIKENSNIEISNIEINLILKEIVYGTIKIQSVPDGAEIFINGKDSEKQTPYTFRLPIGKYTITLKLKGYEDYTQEVNIVKGVPSIINPHLKPKIQLKTYTGKLYTVKYISNWTVLEHPDSETDLEIDSPGFEDDYIASCFIYIQNIKKEGISFQDAVKQEKDSIISSGKLKFISEGTAKYGNNKFYKIVYSGTMKDDEGNDIQIKGAEFLLEKNGILFVIEIDATPNDFSKAWNGFKIILETFLPE